MKLRAFLSVIAMVAAAPAPAMAQSRAVQTDWTRAVARTPEGGFRLGNPEAPLKLIEYFSLTCPHCAAFSAESGPLFSDHVRRGQVSVEYRPYVLNAADIAATLLSRCAAPQRYFAFTHELLASQQSWFERRRTLTEAQRNALRGMPLTQAMPQLAALLGLDAIAARHGIDAARVRACLSNQAGLDELERIGQSAQAQGVRGTPTFFLNGRMLDVNTWSGIAPLLGG